ncbi:subtilisin-like protease SBT1.3 [Aristolochia californica]|uniref:subtilisin-like protease SBT1.3 n=1 Tax=Aristolochia californica TaxID=171875 RepID=UPI0035DB2E6F
MVQSSRTIMGFSLAKMLFFFCLTYQLIITFCYSSAPLARKTYVIQMAKSDMPDSFSHHLEWYHSLVKSAMAEPESFLDTIEDSSNRMIYSYDTAFHGFAAHLTEEEARRLESSHGVVAVHPETVYQLHTTRSPAFLGLEPEDSTIWSAALSDHDVVVGVLDTGIWPESPSFSDKGMTAVPSRWKGICESGRGFNSTDCNKKIIGARIFYRGYEAAVGSFNDKDEFKSPRDRDGHGTHTAATVAGSPVRNANLLGYARGTARGMAPNARIAVYKVCWAGGCFNSDILAAVDQAVSDGVDVLSISLGGGVASYFRDSISIAAFGAMEMGVFVSCSAGNGGPDPVTLTNVSPWITTVGASTMDRDFPSSIKLGNGETITGVSLYRGRRSLSLQSQYPLVYMGGNSSGADPRSLCLEGTLDPHIVSGKIVVCDRGISPRVQKGQVVKDAGGLGMILTNTAANGEELVADCHFIPAVAVGETNGKVIKRYIQAARKSTATLSFAGTKIGIHPSPVVAAFSSRGPNFLTLEVLKPDVVAPGVNILAAWTGAASPTNLPTDVRRVGFNILSGTSMSCPHVSGVAALLKASHPEWSPAAIKSALMTTAYVHDNTHGPLKDAATGEPSTPYDHGAGHIDPPKALDPGLVYDIGAEDYFSFLCSLKLTPAQLKIFSKSSNMSCKNAHKTPGDLNYPAISAVLSDQSSAASLTLRRTVTNVGPSSSTYHVRVSPFKGASVIVEPPILRFTKKNQKLSYKVTFTTKSPQSAPEFGALIWRDGVHAVRSPIVITRLTPI